jgi:hypothetical protein
VNEGVSVAQSILPGAIDLVDCRARLVLAHDALKVFCALERLEGSSISLGRPREQIIDAKVEST